MDARQHRRPRRAPQDPGVLVGHGASVFLSVCLSVVAVCVLLTLCARVQISGEVVDEDWKVFK